MRQKYLSLEFFNHPIISSQTNRCSCKRTGAFDITKMVPVALRIAKKLYMIIIFIKIKRKYQAGITNYLVNKKSRKIQVYLMEPTANPMQNMEMGS